MTAGSEHSQTPKASWIRSSDTIVGWHAAIARASGATRRRFVTVLELDFAYKNIQPRYWATGLERGMSQVLLNFK